MLDFRKECVEFFPKYRDAYQSLLYWAGLISIIETTSRARKSL